MTSAKRKPAYCHLPPTAQLLVEGGDARIALDAHDLNRYGCSPFPDLELVALGSSTASCISPAGFAAADRLRNRLEQGLASEPDAVVYRRELDAVRGELLNLCGASDLHGLEVMFAASGTDLHAIAARLVRAKASTETFAIMVDAVETGSGVRDALAGGADEVATVALRAADGTPRPQADVDADFEAHTMRAAQNGKQVLLVLTDATKTGMIAPSPTCALALRQKHVGALEVLVDACQFRIAPSTLRSYLQQNFMVALTGSKFVGGPPFSGALLIPAGIAHSLRAKELPRRVRDDTVNFGLLLRWEAALAELRAFRAVPEAAVQHFLQEFASAVRQRLSADPVFESLPVPAIERFPADAATTEWDRTQTIFPFLLTGAHDASGRVPLTREETAQIYRLLQVNLSNRHNGSAIAALRCQLGQPVACGQRGGVPVSALRLCASARMVVEATARGGQDTSAVIEKALAALDKTTLVVSAGGNKTGR